MNLVRKWGLDWLPCWAHLLQLPIDFSLYNKKVIFKLNSMTFSLCIFIQCSWNVFKPLLKKVQELLNKFAHSVLAKAELSKWSTKALVFSVPTRWFSALASIQRLQDILEENGAAFIKVKETMMWTKMKDYDPEEEDEDYLIFTQEELLMMRKFVDFFTEFSTKSDIIGGETYSNIQMVFPYTIELFEHITGFIEDPLIGEFAQNFLGKFSEYFNFIVDPLYTGVKYTFQPLYITTAFLSPVFYNGLNEDHKEAAKMFILQELQKLEEMQTPATPARPVPRKSVSLPKLKHFSKMMDASAKNSASSSSSLLERKLKKDLEAFQMDCESKLEEIQAATNTEELMLEDPATYWLINDGKYLSKLPVLARALLSSPPSSVPSERLFSVASLLSSGKFISFQSYIF